MRISVKGNNIKLYGTIWDGDGEYIANELEKVDGNYDTFNIHLHTKGGSVFDGDLIHNAITSMKSNVNIYIDGLAASMGSIIMLAGNKIYAAKSAYIMTHAPRGYAFGTAKDFESTASLLRKMEKSFVSKYAKKTGKTENDVKKLLDGDNWYSAEDALKEGLIDGVVADVLDKEAILAQRDLKIAAYSPEVDPLANIPSNKPQLSNNQTENQMKRELISALAFLAQAGFNEQSSDTAIINAISKRFEELQNERKALADKIKAMEEAQEEERKQAVVKMVEDAVKSGKLTAEQKDVFVAIGEKNGVEALTTVLSKMEVRNPLSASLTPASGGVVKYDNWDEYQEKDPRGLEDLKESNPTVFAELYCKKFGVDFKN